MTAKAAELQREVKENAEDYQNYLKDLYGWENEIKAKDEILRKGPKTPVDDQEFPIRNKKTISANNEKPLLSSPSSSFIEISSNLTSHQNKQKAVLEKNKGNDCFKEGKYEQAIEYYSSAMELDPNDAILPANRAIALIKLNRFSEAEADCNKSLHLDPTFVKAYHRRGTSRANTGKMELAISDFEKVLSIEPHNKAALQELERLLKSRDTNSSKHTTEAKSKDFPLIKSEQPVISTVHPTKSSESIQPKRTSQRVDLSLHHPSLTIIEEIFPKPNTSIIEPTAKISIKSVNDNKQEGLGIDKLLNQILVEKPVEANRIKLPTPAAVVNTVPHAPKNYVQFECDWSKLKNNTFLQFQYLKQLTPMKLPDIFRESLETEILGCIIEILKTEFVQRKEPILPWLSSLSRVKRISAVAMFLPSDRKTDLEFLQNHLSDNKEGSEEERKAVFYKLL